MKATTYMFIIGALIIAIVFGGWISGNATEIRFENCDPSAWVGGVKWEWKDGVRGNYVGSTYHDVPELELKGIGAIVVDLEPGDYAITHYRPPIQGVTQEGQEFVLPAAVLDFREIEVTNEKATYYFGCD